MNGNLELADLLLRQGADINCPNCDNGGNTLLILAASKPVGNYPKRFPNPLLAWLLERGANINARNNNGYTALATSLSEGINPFWSQSDDAMYLLNQGADATIKVGADKSTTLGVIAGTGIPSRAPGSGDGNAEWENKALEQVVRNLVAKGANVNEPNNAGRTPLMNAAETCNEDTVKLFLSLGADPNARDQQGETALNLAISRAIQSRRCNPVVAVLQNPTAIPAAVVQAPVSNAPLASSAPTSQLVRSPEDEANGRTQCEKNSTVEGSVLSGKSYKTSQDYPNVAPNDVFDGVYRSLIKAGNITIKTADSARGIISAYTTNSSPSRTPINFVVEKGTGGGSHVSLAFYTAPLVFSDEEAIKHVFCDTLAEPYHK